MALLTNGNVGKMETDIQALTWNIRLREDAEDRKYFPKEIIGKQ